uniref:Vrga1 n=1 Tax=Aegilops ventricosa TaxID=116981 RepID=Q9SED7_AEGVE|nr:Vrga1 [Aegilops ventricosa]
MDLVLEEALRALARAVDQFRSLGERQMRRCLLGAGDHVSGKLREVATQLDQIRGLLWADDDRSSPARMDRLKEALYGIDDLVDDMEYHSLTFQVESSISSKSNRNPLSSALRLGKRFVSGGGGGGDEASRCRFLKDLDSVASTLSSLLKQAQGSGLPPAVPVPDFDASTLLQGGHKVFGRNKELNDIVQMLVEPPSPHCTACKVVSIVGFGGLGKTTLAQSVYDDLRVKSHFDLRAWAYVSGKPDKVELAKQILRSANPRYGGSIDKDATFATLQLKLNRLMSSKRFLIVLDDIWGDDPFTNEAYNEILSPLRSMESGSRIIAVTQTPKVAGMLDASHTYYLNALGADDCWSLIKESALGGWSTHEESTQELEQIGRKIAAKLNGLPLAAKLMGGLLGATKSTKYWRIISEKEFSGDITLSLLRLSYSYLPGRLKQCFAFCSIFPKNWKFDQTNLVRLWMANGFIQPQSGTGKRMEDLGTDYFNLLLSRSFFHALRQGRRTHYKMHDLIHDMAVSASTEDCCQIEPGMTRRIPSTVRHVSVTTGSLQDVNAAIKILPKNLRTFIVFGNWPHFLEDDSLGKLKNLRALDVCHCDFTELPPAISCLFHLRYLSLSRTIRSLPESISKLLHLQTLCFEDKCSLDKLPAGISRLVKLRHLGIDMKYIAQLPGIGRLINLQGSVEFRVEKGGGHALQELKGIKGLHGQLKIKGLDNVFSRDEASKTDMKSKENLRALTLEWSSACRFLTPVADCEVLENLQPHKNLKELSIVRYLGVTSPSWLQMALLRELQSLHLVNCRSLGVLPALGLLPSLEQLHMKELCTVERIGHEFYGTGDMAFPSLKVLVLDDFPSLVEWSEVRENPLPCLQRLKIVDCPKLIQVPAFPPSVSELTVERTLLISNMKLAPYSSSRSEILTLDISTTSVLSRGLFHQRHLASIIVLNINAGCKHLVAAEGLHTFTSLQKLQLCHSDISDQNLESLLQVLPSLYSFEMIDLPNMTSLLVPANNSLCTTVTELQISNCPLLSSVFSLGTFVSLKHLVIEKCPKLTAASFPVNFWRLTALKVLSISYCTEFQSLPTCGLPTSIEVLHLVGCHPKLHGNSSNKTINSQEEVSTLHKTLAH